VKTDEEALDRAGVRDVFAAVWRTCLQVVRDPIATVLVSAVVLLLVWGNQGRVDLLGVLWKGWTGPGSSGMPGRAAIFPGIPWDQEWISFGIGAVLLIAIPSMIANRALKWPLRDVGLALPPPERRRFAVVAALVLLAISVPGIWSGTRDPAIRATYPLYRGAFSGGAAFFTYELGYVLFFVTNEFVFRGWLLLGLSRAGRDRGLDLGAIPIFVSLLSSTAWHLAKPIPELWSTVVWGIATGTMVLAMRSIWPIVAVHAAINVFMDLVIWKGW
jgi:hypothetical protein